jgi:hypothetical protein
MIAVEVPVLRTHSDSIAEQLQDLHLWIKFFLNFKIFYGINY